MWWKWLLIEKLALQISLFIQLLAAGETHWYKMQNLGMTSSSYEVKVTSVDRFCEGKRN